MGMRFRLSVIGALVACGSGAGVAATDDAGQGVDAAIANDASTDASVFPTASDTCLGGAFVISGQTSSQPAFGTMCGPMSLAIGADGGFAHISDAYSDGGLIMTFDLAPATNGVSNVTTAEGEPYVIGECFSCVCLPAGYPTSMNADAGTLVQSNGVAFVSATGAVQASTPCGDASVVATVWAVCQDAGAAPSAQPANAAFVTGTHVCQAMLGMSGQNALGVAGGGAQDSISIAQSGSHLTVQFDAQIGSGTIAFDVITPNVAIASPNQSATILQCLGFNGGDGGIMPVTAATLVVQDGVILLSVSGALSAGCTIPATEALVLACTL